MQQGEKTIFEGLRFRRNRTDARAGCDQRRDDIRYPIAREAADHDRAAGPALDVAESCGGFVYLGRFGLECDADAFRTTDEICERAECDDATAVDDGDSIADLLDLAEHVRIEEDGRASGLERTKDLADVAPADRVERRRGFVKKDHVGFVDERDREPEPLLHSFGVRADASVRAGGETDQVEAFDDRTAPPAARNAGERAMKAEHLACRQPVLVPEQFGQVSDPPAHVEIARQGAKDARFT
jgi:hypothetical protein